MLPTRFRTSLFVAATLGLAALLAAPLRAQTAGPSLAVSRITAAIDESSRVTLKGTVHPLATAANDRGAAPDSMALERLHLVLKRSPAQEAGLRQLISDLHTPASASYHQWLTPEQFGDQFGPSDQDIATVQSWLASHGFQVGKVQPGKQVLEFSGNAAQLRDAFHTQIHKYVVHGETHTANANDPQIPSALAPVVGGFVSLNNFHPKSYIRVLGQATYNTQTRTAKPEWTYNSQPTFVLAPGDYAVQYDLGPLYAAGINGANQTIAIVNDSNINIDLANQFRSTFGLPANPPQVIIDGNDPGIDGINNPDGPNGDSVEAYLDVEWSGAVAREATIDLVIAADTALESGLYLAAEHAVYANIAPVISMSFGECEAGLGTINTFWNALWEQAAAQGQTVMVSTGDSGSAGCDDDNSQYYAVSGLAVNGEASTPFNVAVGGTDFFYSEYNNPAALETQLATYWNTGTTLQPQTSLLQVIPEQPWNDSQYGLDILNVYALSGNTVTSIAGGGGGVSSCASVSATTGACTGGYKKPAWQTGTGVPADGVRDLPDVSLFASNGWNDSFYPICATDGDCQGPSGNFIQITAVGGTSASAPSFAGIIALVNQRNGRQGQANYVLYPLKAQFPAAFHDVLQGTNSVPCSFSPSSPNCIAFANPITVTDPFYGPAQEGQIGAGTTPDYNAAAGYNLATGLGTVDANVLVNHWGGIKFANTTLSLTSPTAGTAITHGSAVTFTGTVTGTGATPTGDVAIESNSTEPLNQGQTFLTLSNGSFNTPIYLLPGGTYSVWARYGGDATNASSTSAKVQITVNPEASTTYFNVLDMASLPTNTPAITNGGTAVYGTQLILDAELFPTTYYNQCFTNPSPPASCSNGFTFPTGTVTFKDGATTINTAVVNAEGDAEYNAPWSVGPHSVTASYSGDASYIASSAAAIAFTITPDPPTIVLSSAAQTGSATYQGGQATVFTIQVENSANLSNETLYGTYSNPAQAPTGTVTVSGFPAGVPTSAGLSPAVDNKTSSPDGVATIIAPPTTPAGTYSVTINYPGDSNYAATSLGPMSVTIAAPTSGLLASTTAAGYTGTISPITSVTVTGTVTGQSGKPAPTGAVLFFSSGHPLIEVPISPVSGDMSSFSAILNSQTLFQGANLITVQYLGDTNYAQSATTLSINSLLSDFSIVPQAALVSVSAGGGTADTVNVYSVNGFTGTVSFTCNALSGITCPTPSPSSVTLSSGSSAPITLSITAASTAASGNTSVLLTGTSGSFVHTQQIQVFVMAPAASLSPSSVFLGTEPLGTTSPQGTVTLSNMGESALSIASIAIAGANSSDFSLTHNCPASLGVNAVCTIQPTFKPTAAGPRKSSITVSDNSGSGVQTILLTGVGAAISVSPSSLTFSSEPVGTASTAQPVTITNEGSTAVNLWQIAFVGADAGDFSQGTGSNCGASLGAGANCTVNVVFKPAATGSRTASLLISNGGGGSPQAVALSGTGTAAPAVVLSTSAVVFGSQAVGTTSSAETVVLTNKGSAPLAVGSMTVAGASGGDFVQTNTCAASLAPGASCRLEIRFTPRAIGTRTAVINVLRSGNLQLKVRGTGIGREPRPISGGPIKDE